MFSSGVKVMIALPDKRQIALFVYISTKLAHWEIPQIICIVPTVTIKENVRKSLQTLYKTHLAPQSLISGPLA